MRVDRRDGHRRSFGQGHGREQLEAGPGEVRRGVRRGGVGPAARPAPGSFDAARFERWLAGMAAFDARSNKRLVESRALSGATAASLRLAGRRAEWRPDAAAVVSRLARASPVEVVSASWSRELIGGSLDVQVPEAAPRLPVFANALLTEPAGGSATSDGSVLWRVRSAVDKARVMAERRALHGPPVAYIGDSASDLGALVEADVGIVIGESGSLRRSVERLGLRLRPVASLAEMASRGEERWGPAEGVLYLAVSWAEIGDVLLGEGWRDVDG